MQTDAFDMTNIGLMQTLARHRILVHSAAAFALMIVTATIKSCIRLSVQHTTSRQLPFDGDR